jgi:hypothetical protein
MCHRLRLHRKKKGKKHMTDAPLATILRINDARTIDIFRYEEEGNFDRFGYLKDLAENYGAELSMVIEIADLLGPEEDFDGLVTTIEDAAEGCGFGAGMWGRASERRARSAGAAHRCRWPCSQQLPLDLNGALSVPQNFPLPSPWNLPSRLFRGPLEVIRPAKGEPRKVGLMHPGLAAHPLCSTSRRWGSR